MCGVFAFNCYFFEKGHGHKCLPLNSGMADHFQKWLEYTRTFRSSLELPAEFETGSPLRGAVGLLMEFDVNSSSGMQPGETIMWT
jgi:hypothetical protein